VTEQPKSRGPRPGELIAERYRVEQVVAPEPPQRRYFAIEVDGGRRLDIVELPADSAVAWTSAMTIDHPGLPALVATLSRQAGSFGVFERVDGKSLSELIADGIRFEPLAAVRATLWLVEAVARLARADIIHGAINPDCVVFRSDDPESVLLVYRGSLDPDSPFRAPQREDQSLDTSDDLWGVTAILFQLLTGRAPPVGGVYSEEELRAAGIEDDVLRGILAQGLAHDPARRSERLASLRHPLAHWLAERAQRAQQSIPPRLPPQRAKTAGLRALGLSKLSDDPHAPAIEVRSTPLSEPPPPDDPPSIEVRESSPASIALGAEAVENERAAPPEERVSDGLTSLPAMATTSPPKALASSLPDARASSRPRTHRGVWIALGGIAAALTIALLVFLDRRGAESPFADAPPALPSASPALPSSPLALPSSPLPVAPPSSEPAPRAAAHRVPTESTAECVVRHMPEGTFPKLPKMEFLCSTSDPRKGDVLFREALASTNGEGPPPAATRMWSTLSWYALAGFAALRTVCCPDAAPLELPAPALKCGALGPLLDEIGQSVASGSDVRAELSSFGAAVECELEHNRGPVYWQKRPPGGAEPTTLRGLLESVAKPRPPK
jgi:hypothetical protein